MSIEWFRDLVIVIFGLAATLVTIFLAVLAFLIYRKLRPAIDSIRKTAKTVENFSSCMQAGVAWPLAFVQGIRSAMGFVKKCAKREEEE